MLLTANILLCVGLRKSENLFVKCKPISEIIVGKCLEVVFLKISKKNPQRISVLMKIFPKVASYKQFDAIM